MPKPRADINILLMIALLVAIAELGSEERCLAQTTTYTVTQLSSAGDAAQVPCRLNNLGDIVGRRVDPNAGGMRAVVWSHTTGAPMALGVLPGGEYSSANSINDSGVVAGASNTGSAMVPFIWKSNLGLQRVPVLPGDKCGQALGINKIGHVVGYSSGPDGTTAFLWAGSGTVNNLGSLPGGSYSKAVEVNDSDEVVGTSGSPDGNRAVLWTAAGAIQNLGTLPGDTLSEGVAINKNGDVVGYSKGSTGLHGFLWTAAGGMQALGALPGGQTSRALDINDLGYVVGTSSSSSGDRAFLWTPQAGMIDLNSVLPSASGVVLIEAHAINNTGQIIVMGKPVPPGTEGIAPDHEDCNPAPPSTFLLLPASTNSTTVRLQKNQQPRRYTKTLTR